MTPAAFEGAQNLDQSVRLKGHKQFSDHRASQTDSKGELAHGDAGFEIILFNELKLLQKGKKRPFATLRRHPQPSRTNRQIRRVFSISLIAFSMVAIVKVWAWVQGQSASGMKL